MNTVMNSIVRPREVPTTLLAAIFVFSRVGLPLFGQAQFDRGMARQLESDVAAIMSRAQVPGASIAIVQHGQIVYAQGFGVREKGKPARATAESLMMIGSTGKSMTTMMMAALVDQGSIRWDTPPAKL